MDPTYVFLSSILLYTVVFTWDQTLITNSFAKPSPNLCRFAIPNSPLPRGGLHNQLSEMWAPIAERLSHPASSFMVQVTSPGDCTMHM